MLCAQVEQDALREQMIEGNSLEWFNWKTSMPLTTQVTVLYVKFDIIFCGVTSQWTHKFNHFFL
jgi:hypothetical protein